MNYAYHGSAAPAVVSWSLMPLRARARRCSQTPFIAVLRSPMRATKRAVVQELVQRQQDCVLVVSVGLAQVTESDEAFDFGISKVQGDASQTLSPALSVSAHRRAPAVIPVTCSELRGVFIWNCRHSLRISSSRLEHSEIYSM